ncbi:MAG: Shikimate dehydrogenase (NADP(+)) [Chlamydiae bacterium]|nr:Shikimate dehydrogenase (NADP(+)) [Chlamydiota bacterium]
MIIVSLAEKNYATLLKKIKLAKKDADLIEVRLDALATITLTQLQSLNQNFSPLFTLRTKNEGGFCTRSSSQRNLFLKELIDLKPDYLDLEFKKDFSLIAYLKKQSPKTKLILSKHYLQKMPHRLGTLISKMKKESPWKVKIAASANSILDALKMLTLMKKYPDFIGIAMGEKGTLSRILAPLCKQPYTYASLNDTEKTAKGQLTLKDLQKLYNYSKLNSKTKLLGLIGNPISQSPGYKVYNALFKELKMNAVYVNVEVEKNKIKKVIPLLKELGFLGASVTIPFKESLFSFVKDMPKNQKGISAINTLYYSNSVVKAMNSDGMAALNLFNEGGVAEKKVLIIGAGGTAKGIGFVLKKAGAHVTFINRTEKKARALARSLKVNSLPFKTLNCLKKEDYDILVQATSVGGQGSQASLVPAKCLYSGKRILDVVLSNTKLIETAKKKGCRVYTGKTFWIAQGELQLRFWFRKLSSDVTKLMKKYMP